MTNINATGFRKKMFSLLDQTVKFNEPVNIVTKNGNAVLLSGEDYNAFLTMLDIYNNPTLYNKIMKGKETPVEECISEDDVQW